MRGTRPPPPPAAPARRGPAADSGCPAARVSRTTHSTSARVSARVVSACGFGLAGSVQPAGGRGGVDREAAATSAVRRARVVVAADVGRQRDVGARVGADQIRRHAQSPELRRSERLDDLRAGASRPCSDRAGWRAGAGAPCPRSGPTRAPARCPARRAPAAPPGTREPQVHRRLPRRDPREGAVPDRAARGAFVEAEMDEGPDEVARLRVADGDHVADRAGDRIRRALRVGGGAAEERRDVARRRQADAEHQRILRGVGELVEPRRIEAALQAQRVGSGVPGNGTVRQSANAQSARGTLADVALHAGRGLAADADQARVAADRGRPGG